MDSAGQVSAVQSLVNYPQETVPRTNVPKNFFIIVEKKNISVSNYIVVHVLDKDTLSISFKFN